MIVRKIRGLAAAAIIGIIALSLSSCGLLSLFGIQGPAAPVLVVTSKIGISHLDLVVPGNSATLDVSDSYDPNGDPFAISWTLAVPTGATSTLVSNTGPVASFIPTSLVDGKYTLTAILSDGKKSATWSIDLYTPAAVAQIEGAWPFDNSSIDISLPSYNFAGGPGSYTGDRFGTPTAALQFINTDAATYAIGGTEMMLDPSDPTYGDFSAAFWMNFTAMPAANAAIISVDDGNTAAAPGWRLGTDTSSNFGFVADPGSLNGDLSIFSSQVAIGEWHHYAMTYDQSSQSLKLYLDGTMEASATITTPVTNPTDFIVGVQGGGVTGFDGIIDDLLVMNNVLPADKIAAMAADY